MAARVLAPEANAKVWNIQVAKLRKYLRLQPIDFCEEELFKWVEATVDMGVDLVRRANDEDRLKMLAR